MNNETSNIYNLELACVIVEYGKGSKILKSAKAKGFSGGTVLIGRGTLGNKILSLMGLGEAKKEIILLVGDRQKARYVLDKINDEFKLGKPHSGIAFTTPISEVFGTKYITCENDYQERKIEENMYKIITTIVDKGIGEDVISAADKAGSKGGTIINARGAGVHETSKVFSMEIEPEKEVVIILAESDQTDKIVDSIRKDLKIDEPGKGVIYVQDTGKTYGIHK